MVWQQRREQKEELQQLILAMKTEERRASGYLMKEKGKDFLENKIALNSLDRSCGPRRYPTPLAPFSFHRLSIAALSGEENTVLPSTILLQIPPSAG